MIPIMNSKGKPKNVLRSYKGHASSVKMSVNSVMRNKAWPLLD